MKELFGLRSDGRSAYLYTITGGGLTAVVSDHGATLIRLYAPDAKGNVEDVILGFDKPDDYTASTTYFGATVGRNANRVGGAKFSLNGVTYKIDANDNEVNNLHSGFDPYKNRLWEVVSHETNSIRLHLSSPDGDQGFPGNADIYVTYKLDNEGCLCIIYDGLCDQDTVFNMTNHTYFNLAGHKNPQKAMSQILSMPARHFTACDALSIPTGENRSVEGSPMDFRQPKAIGRDLGEKYDALELQGGYDHNFEVYTNPCATLSDPVSGRTMEVYTDCCGIQFYSGNFLMGETGKDGVSYIHRGGICLETQFYPDAINHPDWAQPITKAGQPYHSETKYKFL
ncbi:MAG: galactose mutarotase [Ruminococcaceae bacterium]|nr:galactose mutarotase [Oscillospiraceae bacterium]